MWFHHELKGQGYRAAMTGVAVSDNITGPYKYIRSLRPMPESGRKFSQRAKKFSIRETTLRAGRMNGKMLSWRAYL